MSVISDKHDFSEQAERTVKTLPLAFVRRDSCWHVEVYRNANGTARIIRHSGIQCEPMIWDSPDRTPEDWVSIQPEVGHYVPFAEFVKGAH